MIQYLSCNSRNEENIDLWQNMKKRMFLAGGTTAIKTRGQGNKRHVTRRILTSYFD